MGLKPIIALHKSRLGHLIFGVVELGLFIGLTDLAIPSGDWWEWLAALLLLVGAVQNLGRMVARAHQK